MPRGIGPSIEHTELLAGRRYRTVLDVGANVGQFALWAQDALAPERIVCVEPQADAAARIRRIAARSSCAIDVVEVAVGAARGTATLHVTAASDSSSVLAPLPEVQAARSAMRVRATRPVEVVPGDEVLGGALDGPVLLKVDVQGTELAVLQGLRSVLEQVSAVLVEVSFGALYRDQSSPGRVIELLLAAGFELQGMAQVPGGSRGWTIEQADLLFERAPGGT